MGISSGDKGLSEIGGVDVEVIWVAADSLSLDDQREWDGAFDG